MGVLGLWQLLQPSSRPLKLQGLEGKRLAIDISIWLYQATKGAKNSRNGHIAVLYSRICKLLYFKIKPIFVFDGPNVPKLKERVLRNRQRNRNAAADKAKDLEEKIQKNILESYALQNVLGVQNNSEKPDLNRPTSSKKSDFDDDLFKLPENSEFDLKIIEEDMIEGDVEGDDFVEITDSQFSFGVGVGLKDIDKEVFDSLPPDIQYELLTSYKDALKAKKSQSFDEFPEQSEDFSSFQMKSLLHKNEISSQINNLKNSMKKQHIMNTQFENVYHQKVASEDHDEVILLTRKSSSSKLFSQKSATQMQIDEEDKEEDIIINNDSNKLDKSPEYRIEFDKFNKIELVPKTSQISQTQRDETAYLDSQKLQPPSKHQSILGSSQVKAPLSKTNSIEIILQINGDEEIASKEKPELVIIKETQSSSRPKVVPREDVEFLFQNTSLTKSPSVQPSIEKSPNTPKISNENKIIVKIPPTFVEINDTEPKEINEIENTESEDDDFIEVTYEEKATPPKSVPIQQSAKISPSPINTQPTTSKKANQQDLIDIEAADNYNDYLLNERNEFLKQKKNSENLSNSIERYVIEDAKHLLQLFGLPFLTAPGEAEAQCAYLDYTNVTEGSITEDSDVWLFGARRVYKNFFSTDQFIDSYSHQVIKSQLGLDRDSLINVALLVGSDYTEGVENVGIVKAVEILQEFEGDGLEKLKNFKQWHEKAQQNPVLKHKNNLRKLLSKLKLSADFPSEVVHNAYINPDVDKSNEEFSWSIPSLDQLRQYLASKMGWTNKKVDDDLLPVIRRINETNVQKTIDTFFQYETTSSFSKQSKRMKNAIKSIKSKNNESAATKVDTQSDDHLNLSNDDDESDELAVAEHKKKKATTTTVSSIKITRLKRSAQAQPEQKQNNEQEDLILMDKPIETNTSTTSKRKSNESTAIKKKVAKKKSTQ